LLCPALVAQLILSGEKEMKKFLAALVILFVSEAFAQNPHQPLPGYRFDMANAQSQNIESLERAVGGSLVIGQKEVELQVKMALVCPPGKFCPEYIPNPILVRLQYVQRIPGNCGDKYIAVRDSRAVDGVFHQLEIMDFSHSRCMMLNPYKIQANYSVSYMDRAQRRVITKTDVYFFNPALAIR
jgi:hypothetical protein